MNKKLLVSVLLCFFVFSSVMLATENKANAQTIEHLVWADMGRNYEYEVDLSPAREDFNLGPLMTFSVPGSRRSKALFFEIWTQARGNYWTHEGIKQRYASVGLALRIISPIIPANIKVKTGMVVHKGGEENSNGIYERYGFSSRRNVKLIMRRNNVDGWQGKKDSGEFVIDEDMISILNSLMDSGFDVEVYAECFTLGVSWLWVPPFTYIEVTRLSQKWGWW